MSNIWIRIKHLVRTLNLFESRASADGDIRALRNEIIITRLFLILLGITISVLLIYLSLTNVTQNVLVDSPSIDIFERLHDQYSATLTCPCSESTIRYDQFIDIEPVYHQICSSDFVSSEWLLSIYLANMSFYYPLDFRTSAPSIFRLLALMCTTAQRAIDDARSVFNSNRLVNTQALEPTAFVQQSDALTRSLVSTTISNEQRTLSLINFLIFQNLLWSALRINAFYVYAIEWQELGGSLGYFPLFPNGTNPYCSCMLENDCLSPSMVGIYENVSERVPGDVYYDVQQPQYSVPGMRIACLPYNSLSASTLACLYDAECLDRVSTHPWTPLNGSSNDTINTLINNLFVIKWLNTANFTGYYHTCAPLSCSYTYQERLALGYIITTLIGLIGGLVTGLRFIAPLLIMIARWIQTKWNLRKSKQINPTITMAQNQPKGLPVNVRLLRDRFILAMRQLNVFKDETNDDMQRDGLIATRLYILILLSVLAMIVLYTSLSIHTQLVIVQSPSQSTFEALFKDYSNTLVCPCTQVAIARNQFLNIQPIFHQVCSSAFVEQVWLDYFNLMQYSGEDAISIWLFDFRIAGATFFGLLAQLCTVANDTVSEAWQVYAQSELATGHVFGREEFDAQMNVLTNEFQSQTPAAFRLLVDLVKKSIDGNQLLSLFATNSKPIDTLPDHWQQDLTDGNVVPINWIARTSFIDGCSCATSSQCWTPIGFFCTLDSPCDNHSLSLEPHYPVPGLVAGCLTIDSVFQSTLECFFSRACVDMLFALRGYDQNNTLVPPNEQTYNISILDYTRLIRYTPNTTLDTIVKDLFVEEWINTSNFSSYYYKCAPKQCSYTYSHRFAFIFVLTTLIAVYGSLNGALKLLALPTVRLARYTRRLSFRDLHTRYVHAYISHFIKYLRSLNLFKPRWSQVEQQPSPKDELVATQTYIFLLLGSVFIVLISSALKQVSHNIIVQSPSFNTFEQLYHQYPATLTCPCSKISIRYDQFIDIDPVYHQVCSSDFMNRSWLIALYGSGNESILLDRPVLSAHFGLLSTFCSVVETFVNDNLFVFLSNELVTVKTMTQRSFEAQAESFIDQFIFQTPAVLNRTLALITGLFHGNQLLSLYANNWVQQLGSQPIFAQIETLPVTYQNDSCSCALTEMCRRPMRLRTIDNQQEITYEPPGFVVGCLPIDGFLFSTFECLYSSECVDQITALVNADGNNLLMRHLDNSSTSRYFSANGSTTFASLVSSLFVEQWLRANNYTAYYSACAPGSCYYSVIKREDALNIITTLLSIYGGLVLILRTLIGTIGLPMYRFIKERYQRRHQVGIA